jgi:hypothetical protein
MHFAFGWHLKVLDQRREVTSEQFVTVHGEKEIEPAAWLWEGVLLRKKSGVGYVETTTNCKTIRARSEADLTLSWKLFQPPDYSCLLEVGISIREPIQCLDEVVEDSTVSVVWVEGSPNVQYRHEFWIGGVVQSRSHPHSADLFLFFLRVLGRKSIIIYVPYFSV